MATIDYDLYGINFAVNDGLVVSADNFVSKWFPFLLASNDDVFCPVSYSETTCSFVYSTMVPVINNSLFVYNCIDHQGNNVIGFFMNTTTCKFQLSNE